MVWTQIISRTLGFACQGLIILLCFLPLFLWSLFEAIFVEIWRLCAPANRNPNRAPSSGLIFAMRSIKRRRLSDPPIPKNISPQSTVETRQPKPRGFFDLPYELREQIWLDVLCPVSGVHVTNHPRARKVTWAMRDLEEGRNPSQYGLTKMLKLNRNFYREGIELLYKHNCFEFTSPNILTSFTRTVLPKRLALIRHLTLTVRCGALLYSLGRYRHSFMEKDWNMACLSLQAFTGLKTLLINIRIESHHSPRSTQGKWDGFSRHKWPQRILGPLEPVKASDAFIVRYTWPKRDCSEWPKGNFKMMHELGYA